MKSIEEIKHSNRRAATKKEYTSPTLVVLEEALDCVLTRVRWYTLRHYKIPDATALAFNYLCNVLGKPHERPYMRITR